MPKRHIDNVDEKIIDAILKIGAVEGVKQVSADKITKICGISDSTVYAHFKTKRDYLDAAAEHFDRKYMAEAQRLAARNYTPRQIWDIILDMFLADPDGAMYYNHYTAAFGYDVTMNNPRAAEFLVIARGFFKTSKQLDDSVYLLLWDYITSMAFYYAEKFIHGYLPNTPKVREQIRAIVFSGIDSLL